MRGSAQNDADERRYTGRGVEHRSAQKIEQIEQVDSKNGKQWQISFKNPAVTEQGKAAHLVFMRLPSNYVVAKFTAQ